MERRRKRCLEAALRRLHRCVSNEVGIQEDWPAEDSVCILLIRYSAFLIQWEFMTKIGQLKDSVCKLLDTLLAMLMHAITMEGNFKGHFRFCCDSYDSLS
jgi:hypothetical protein